MAVLFLICIDEFIDGLPCLVRYHLAHLLVLLKLPVQVVDRVNERPLFQYPLGEFEILIVDPCCFLLLCIVIEGSIVARWCRFIALESFESGGW